ncbi:MAG: hypothetical protein K8U57_10995 [Planctomycetes bacterium]|nr:hypothetical protein [Planctomycetota bacterium]
MFRRSHVLTAVALAILVGPGVNSVVAQDKTEYPRMRAALHELRDARRALETVESPVPLPLRETALASTQDAINSLKAILGVKDLKDFRGVDRTPEYYKRYADHPRLRAALDDLRVARDELRSTTSDFAGLKERALDDIDVAVGDIIRLIRATSKPKP